MLFEGKWAFDDKDVEELLVEIEVDAGNADVARIAVEWGVKVCDATTMSVFCRSI